MDSRRRPRASSEARANPGQEIHSCKTPLIPPRYAFHGCSALIRKGMDMRNRNLLNWVLLLLLAVVSSLTQAQRSVPAAAEPKAWTISTSDLTTPVLKEIQDIDERMVAVAADFPDEL